jgi:subtilisin family serine protease
VLVWKSNKPVVLNSKKRINIPSEKIQNLSDIKYGSAFDNINLNNGQFLHELGYKGSGMDIAVIDAAFVDITSNPQLKNIHIKGAKSFIYEDQDPYGTDSHGVWTTSCMATNMQGYYVGTAPEANYWLLRSEDIDTEYPVEQDYWVAAIEYADSVGVDVVNTSLYYTSSDFAPYKFKFENLDGKTEIATRGANMAADKGILIFCCAGNLGSWIGTPGDSPNVLTVGAVNNKGIIADFSSFGLTVDGRIKPDVVALGSGAAVIPVSGSFIDHRFGTSYSSPILCGLAACLWQSNPNLTNKQLLDIIKKSADRYNNPLLPYGYGIPNMQKAYELSR